MITVFLSLLETEEEKQSFKKLYYKYVHLMIDIAYKRVSNYSVAEECVQEAFFYVAKNYNKIDDINSSTTRNFLAVITDSFAIKAYHKENKQKNLIKLKAEAITEIPDSYFNDFNIIEIKDAINSLDDDIKNLFYLKYIAGLNYKEITQITGLSEYKIRSSLNEAKNSIKNFLQKE